MRFFSQCTTSSASRCVIARSSDSSPVSASASSQASSCAGCGAWSLFVLDEPDAAQRPRVLFVDFGLSRRLDPDLRRAMRQGIYALMQRDAAAFVARMNEMRMIAPGAEPGVRRAVTAMLERIAAQAGGAGMLGASGAQVLGLKDEAKQLLQETPGLQLPNDLLLYAKTLSYLFALGEDLDPDVDLMKLSIPYLLQFLATRD